MDKYDYYKEVKEDVKNYIDENVNIKNYSSRKSLEDALNEELLVDDSVTGNASGSYTFNTWQAEENLCHNWDLLKEALENFGQTDANAIEKGAEWCDLTVRCYLLPSAVSQVLDGMNLNFDECEDDE